MKYTEIKVKGILNVKDMFEAARKKAKPNDEMMDEPGDVANKFGTEPLIDNNDENSNPLGMLGSKKVDLGLETISDLIADKVEMKVKNLITNLVEPEAKPREIIEAGTHILGAEEELKIVKIIGSKDLESFEENVKEVNFVKLDVSEIEVCFYCRICYMSRTQKAAYFSILRTLIKRRKAIMTHNLETSETLNLISRNISQRIKIICIRWRLKKKVSTTLDLRK